jgi:hypothetical protein
MNKISITCGLLLSCLFAVTSGSWAQLTDSDADGVNDYRETQDGTDLADPSSFNPLSRGLVAYYSFNGNANDLSGYSNNLTLNGASTFTADRFGSTNLALGTLTTWTTLESEQLIPIQGNSERTVSFWAKFAAFNNVTSGVSVGWGTLEQAGNYAVLAHSPTNGFIWAYGHYADSGSFPSTPPSYDEWRQIVYVYKDSILNGLFYINGQSTPLNDLSGLNQRTDLNSVSTLLRIQGGTGDSLDDVMIYNRALSPQEVTDLYTTQSVPEPSTYALLLLAGAGAAAMARRRAGRE